MSEESLIKAVVEDPVFPASLQTMTPYTRFEDDSRRGFISVIISSDGDGFIEIHSESDENDPKWSFRFRVPGQGGGESPRVRNALLVLAEAIRLDNLERPQSR